MSETKTPKQARDDCLTKLKDLYRKALEGKDIALAHEIARDIYGKELDAPSHDDIMEAVAQGWGDASINTVLAAAIVDKIMEIH